MIDLVRWHARQNKHKPKDKSRVYEFMTQHALARADQRGVRVKDILEGRANIEPRFTPDGRYATVVPATHQWKRAISPQKRK